MNDSSNICLSCGLCCDGSLVGFVDVNNEELPALKELMEIDEEQSHGFFLLPCDNLGCNGCTIYSDRPKQCRSFNCGLLNAVTNKDVAFDSAKTTIKEVKAKKEVILKKLLTLEIELQSKSFYFQMVELKKLLVSDNQQHQDILLDIDVLDQLITKEFGVSLT